MEWLTHFELSGGLATPTYSESMEFIDKMAAKSRHAKVLTFGRTPQGRDMKCVVMGAVKTPEDARKRKKAVVFIQNVIHGGEMEGKDAWMLLMRDILITKKLRHLLDHLVLVMIPIFNIDGHERRGHTNRPNQIGPTEQGWRTTAQNLDLNRDFMKADAPEMKALLKLYHYWLPDFCFDNHCTDGADFQYRILYSFATHQNIHPVLADWVEDRLLPNLIRGMEDRGIPIAPYNEGAVLTELVNAPANPRVSTGYSAIQNRVCLLVEAHSLKTYADRVDSTRAMNLTVLEYLNDHHMELIQRNRIADEDSIHEYCIGKAPFPISLSLVKESEPYLFQGYASYEEESPITGDRVIRYTKEPVEVELPYYFRGEITETVHVPDAYYIPPEYAHIAEHLRLHGIEVEQVKRAQWADVERYRFSEVSFARSPYESRFRVNFQLEKYGTKVWLAENGFLVRTAQRGLRAILHLLEPVAPDSLVRWGFFQSIFERKEYAEPYIMEPIAQKMLAEDEELRKTFAALLEDEEFRNDPNRRLDLFYQRSVYFDRGEKVYPIVRLLELPHV